MNMDCKDISVLLSGLLDDELPPETRHQAERHLAGCQTCTKMVNEAETLDVLTGTESAAIDELPAGFEQAVLLQTSRQGSLPAASSRWVTFSGWLAAAAAIGLAFTIWVADNRVRVNPKVAAGREFNPAPTDDRIIPQGVTVRNIVPQFISDVNADFYPPEIFALPVSNRPIPDAEAPIVISDMNDDDLAALRREATLSPGMGLLQSATHPGDAFQLEVGTNVVELPRMSREDFETLYATSTILEMLIDADTDDFRDIELVRGVVEYDHLVDRLTEARGRLESADRPAIFAIESILHRIEHGPMSLGDFRLLQQTVTELDLPGQLEALSNRWTRPNPL